MDRKVWGVELLSSQIQAVNAILILILIPLFSYGIYPFCEKFFRLTPLRKIGIGLFLTVPSFLLPAWIELQIARGLHPHIGWQFFDYLIITAAEVMVSITSLEFSYTQAPKKMKSLIMSIYLLAIALGNAITAGINYFIQNPDGTSKLTGVEYYLFFSALMFVAAVLFVFVARFYKDRTHLQEETAL
jgi:POT family proton-dependent oligopeptide transporter